MGGNLFKEAKRVSKEKYFSLVSELDNILYPLTRHVVKAYKDKTDFGDIDIVLLKKDYDDVFKRFKDYPMEKTEGFSILYKETQVDFIFINEKVFDFACKYFNYNDLGNLIGRVSHKLGLKFGFNGLFLIVRDGNSYLGDIVVSSDFEESLSFLGYDAERYSQGFNTLEEIFEYVATSPYFNKSIYLFHNRNHTSTVRDKKRPTYNKFLEWCKNREGLTEYPHESFEEKGGYNIKDKFLPMIYERFPHVKAMYDALLEKHQKNLLYKSYINGEVFMEITGLSGKELGKLMGKVKDETTLMNEQELAQYVLDFRKHYENANVG